MRAKLATIAITGALLVMAACATTKDYVICNDLATNVTCRDNTANVVIGM